MRIALIIAAAGSGERFSSPSADGDSFTGRNKLWLDLNGEPLFMRSLRNLGPLCSPGSVVVAANPLLLEEFRKTIDNGKLPFPVKIAAGGATRALSVENALAALDGDDGIVGIHDGARPLADAGLFDSLCRMAEAEYPCGIIPAAKAADTLKTVDAGGTVTGDADRRSTVLVGTPQVFPLKRLRAAYAAVSAENCTDDAGVYQAAGGTVKVFYSDGPNIKITHPADWELIKKLVPPSAMSYDDK